MAEIDGLTRLCGLIGFPVDHSLSPLLHNFAYRALGLNYRYLAFPVRRENLEAALRGLAALNVAGINVTAPYKEAVIPSIDYLDPPAADTGSVNTICFREGKREGYSTDGEGFLRSLKEERGYSPSGETILLLGAGGAARAVGYALAGGGARRLILLNRSRARARSLAGRLQGKFGALELETADLSTASVEHYWPRASLVINALSADPWPWAELHIPRQEGVLACDLRYSPPRSPFLERARRSGAETLNGLGMLLAQAALSFKLFTGVEPPLDLMKKALIDN